MQLRLLLAALLLLVLAPLIGSSPTQRPALITATFDGIAHVLSAISPTTLAAS